MKFLGCLLLVLAAVHADRSISDIERETGARVVLQPRQAFTRPSLRSSLARAGECVEDQVVCKNDELTFCFLGETITVNCTYNLGLRTGIGYCNCEGTECTTRVPTNCPIPPKTTCPDSQNDEKFPDNQDCKAFTYCGKGILYHLKCPDGLVYSPRHENGTCVSPTVAPCRTCKCPSTAGPLFVPFPQDPRYYLLCYLGKFTINKCKIESYVAEKNRCVFGCQKAGVFCDTDPTRATDGYYYSCTGSFPYFRKQEHKCPIKGDVFDEKKGLCLKPSNGGTGGSGGSDNTGGSGGSDNTGGSGGSDNTGGSGGSDNTGGSGGSDNTGGSGGSDNTGGSGGSDNTGGSGGSGGTP